MITKLTPDQFRRTCQPGEVGCASTSEVTSLQRIIGQERAVRALSFGLGIDEKGFNIFVAGLPGTGRTTAIRAYLEDLASQAKPPSDWCYVTGFQDNYRPNALRLPAGGAAGFAAEMSSLVTAAQRDIRAAFESEAAAVQRDGLLQRYHAQKQEILEKLGAQAYAEGFTIQATSTGLASVPLVNGKPISEDTYLALSQEEQQAIGEKQGRIQALIEASIRQARQVDRLAQAALQEMEREIALAAIRLRFEEVLSKFADIPEIPEHLKLVQNDLLDHLVDVLPAKDEEESGLFGGGRRVDLGRKYTVNVLVDNRGLAGAPVVVERNPTYGNLFGRIEQEAQFGALVTDFTMIRPGSLHRANGGYLVLPAEELLRNPLSWESLKRALVNDEIVIEDAADKLGYLSTRGLRPEPIPLQVKVVLVGRPEVYQALLELDEHFHELFKVKADFDTRMPRTAENLENYAALVARIIDRESLLPMEASGIARLVEHSSRLAEDQEKLTTRFGEIADVVREASHYAANEGAKAITAEHVARAVEEQHYRAGLVEERMLEAIERGLVQIEVSGERIGQVNGLSVLAAGDVHFGQPSRISASVGVGRDGLVDIERQSELSGPLHTKGVLILAGFLATHFAYNKPLSLSARLVFEQSYSGVDGDSASSAELYALLSALSGLPVRQEIAVTGAVDQHGQVQAIGGINQKIEGFFAVCEAHGLTGEQGVIIPHDNQAHLMLKEELVQAAKNGKFHIWAVENIREGIEILTGEPAGVRTEAGYPAGSVFARVDDRLREFAEVLKRYRG